MADVQIRLTALGYPVGASGADGVFAEHTERAVRAFQAARGLTVSGVVDGRTWRELVDANLSLGDRTLYLRRPQMHGDDVRELQQVLATLGFSPGAIDGFFGTSTERAVREFQKSVGLIADGIVGRATLRAAANLAPALAARGPAPPNNHQAVSTFGAGLLAMRVVVRPSGDALASMQVARECALRLANLLELAGANAEIRGRTSEGDDAGGEKAGPLAVSFTGLAEPLRLAIGLAGGLAGSVRAELAPGLPRRLEGRVQVSSEGDLGGDDQPLEVNVDVSSAKEGETLCQRIAVAVFDAIAAAAERVGAGVAG